MKHFFFSMVILAAAPTVLHAQYSSPAFDPKCYFPSVNDPSETQVIYGTQNDQLLGDGMLNIGPAPGESQSRLMFAGLPQSPVFLSAVRTGTSFDLNDLDIQGTTNLPMVTWGSNEFGSWQYRFWTEGHFHTHDRLDLLYRETGDGDAWRIYWADGNGLYDSTHYTELAFDSEERPFPTTPYVANLTSDTVDDLVFGYSQNLHDTIWNTSLDLYQGGESFYNRKLYLEHIATPDSIFVMWTGVLSASHPLADAAFGGAFSQGDFRGVGREDLIAGDFFYANDSPFSLEKLAHAVEFDTLWTYREWTKFDPTINNGIIEQIAIPAFSTGNDDFLLLYKDINGNADINIFKGGPTFGSNRILLDSPDFVILAPEEVDPAFSGGHYITESGHRTGDFYDCGDMTGTGKHVLEWQREDGSGDDFQFFYVLGPGMTGKADMFIAGYYAGVESDTLTANGDNLEDVALGYPAMYDTVGTTSLKDAGRVEIVYGTNKIPVPTSKVETQMGFAGTITAWPNPLSTSGSITWKSFEPGPSTFRLRDILGRTAFEVPFVASAANFHFNIPQLPNGEYILELEQSGTIQRTKVVIQN